VICYTRREPDVGAGSQVVLRRGGTEFDYGGSAGAATAHLITYELDTARKTTWARCCWRTAAAFWVYLVGAIEVMRTAGKALEAARDTGGVPYRLASMIYRLR
jgi:hypothetical protein